MRARSLSVLGAALGLAVTAPAGVTDEPAEPPAGAEPREPGRPAEVTIERLAHAIEAWVAWDTKLHGRSFLFRDEERGGTLELKLDEVHRDRLYAVGDGEYFACADFTASDGAVYDLDVFMRAGPGSPFEGLWPTRILVHEKDGEPRHVWREENGRWTRTTD